MTRARMTFTAPDRETVPMDYAEAFAACAALAGQRVRLTYPNGARRAGLVTVYQAPRHPAWKPDAPDAEPVIRFDGAMVGGELAGCVAVEVMQGTRYVPVPRAAEIAGDVETGSDAVHGDTCVDDRGTDAEPFRVMVWTGARASRNRGGYWSHWANYAEQRDAERIARGMVASNTDAHDSARDEYGTPLQRPRFHGVTRHRFPLP